MWPVYSWWINWKNELIRMSCTLLNVYSPLLWFIYQVPTMCQSLYKSKNLEMNKFWIVNLVVWLRTQIHELIPPPLTPSINVTTMSTNKSVLHYKKKFKDFFHIHLFHLPTSSSPAEGPIEWTSKSKYLSSLSVLHLHLYFHYCDQSQNLPLWLIGLPASSLALYNSFFPLIVAWIIF